ncbi:MAG: hypothetical protein H6666_12775 [Ardenticatenaceae bacterium]|nr:hypothetical protein [Anaerolineales bacterium]MCB8918782.1 hypothetical protein [Ardenticatenaceae bacterium]
MAQQSATAHHYFALTVPGLEQAAWLEIRQRLPAAQFEKSLFAKNEHGVVIFRYAGPAADLLALRTVEDLFLVVTWLPKLTRTWGDLREVQQRLTKSGDLGRGLNLLGRFRRRGPGSYQVVARKYGEHQYSRKDWTKMVTQAVDAVYAPMPAVRQNPEVLVGAFAYGSEALVGVRLAPGNLSLARLPSRPGSVAAAMVWLTEPDPADTFLDLVSAGDLVLRERLAVGECAALWAADGLVPRPGSHKLGRTVVTYRWRDGRLPLADASVAKVASFLPPNPDLCQTALTELARLLRPGGRAALFTHEFEATKSMMRQFDQLQIQGGYSLLVGERWARIYSVIRRS